MSEQEKVIHAGDADFEAVALKADKPVLVDFWAPWCGPCRTIGPLLEDLAGAYADRVKVVKVNVDDNEKTARAYGISSIPTLLVFKGGKIVDQAIGLVSRDRLTQMLDKAL